MRFAEKGYYVEQYVKCANCGMLIYGEALDGELGDQPALFCSEWCCDWPSLRETWTKQSPPRET
jgi:N-methylhydantoinase B